MDILDRSTANTLLYAAANTEIVNMDSHLVELARERYPLVESPDSCSTIVLDDPPTPTPTPYISTTQEYFAHRSELQEREASLGFQSACRNAATEDERRANDILQDLKDRDALAFKNAPRREGYGGQVHPRFPGDHFLSNIDLLEETDVFRAVSKMPKGAHLHIHFNNNLPPEFLLKVAAGMEHMFIKSDRRLLKEADLDSCKVEFLIRSETEERNDDREWDLCSDRYECDQWMKFMRFPEAFCARFPGWSSHAWLQSKLVFHEDETYNKWQTSWG